LRTCGSARLIDSLVHLKAVLLWLLLSAAMVSCRAGGIVQVSPFDEDDSVMPETITFVNWNAQKGTHTHFRQDLESMIERHKPHLIFLQEARADLIEPQTMGGYFASCWSYPWPEGKAIGVMTLSKAAPLKTQPLPTKWREFFVTAPKISFVTEYRLPNGEIMLAVNAHLLNFERWGTMKVRDQLDELKTVISQHEGPILLAGDFNTWNERRLGLVRELAKETGLVEITGFPPGRTTASKDSEILDWFLGIDSKLPLDRVYYRGFREQGAEVLEYSSSDHNAILVRLRLQK
jgi:endonuclease/exonuclease/phosphatase (EEP) superfamily protein YafD